MQTTPASLQAPEANTTILEIIGQRLIQPLFQPIVDLATTAVVGLEALARGPAGTDMQYPDRLFAAARAAGRVGDLDMLCAERALECALEATDPPPLLFVNAEPAALVQPVSPRLVELVGAGLPFLQVLEYTERALPTVPGGMLRLAGVMRIFGHSIALDDVGVDPLSLAFLPILEPEIIKLDMGLIRDPHAASTARVASIVQAQVQRTGAMIIAEGIETRDDLATAAQLGACWGQGWLFGRPGPIQNARHRYDAEAARCLPTPLPEYSEPTATPFEATHGRAPAVPATAQDLTGCLAPLRGILTQDPDAIVIASQPADTIAELIDPVHTLFGNARSLIMLDEPIPSEFAVAVLGAGYGHGLCVRNHPHLQIRHLGQLPAVAEIARNLLLRLPDPFPPGESGQEPPFVTAGIPSASADRE